MHTTDACVWELILPETSSGYNHKRVLHSHKGNSNAAGSSYIYTLLHSLAKGSVLNQQCSQVHRCIQIVLCSIRLESELMTARNLGQVVLVWILTLSAHRDLLVSAINTTAENRVAILALAPYGVGGQQANPAWKAGPALIPALRLAVDRINNRADVLPGHYIQLLEGNSGCQHESTSAYGLISNVFYDGAGPRIHPHVVGVIGPACSESALLIGTLGARDRVSLIQISPTATSPLLTDTVKYCNTFRTLSTALQHVGALAHLMTLNSWENVAVLYDHSRQYFRRPFERLINTQSNKIGFSSEIYSGYYQMESILAQFKVIILIATNQMAREVICLAHHSQPKISYPVYQWIIVDHLNFTLAQKVTFIYNGRFYNCTQELMMEALEGAITISYHFLTQELNDQPTDVELTTEQYYGLYLTYLKKHLMELRLNGRDTSY